jgi:hypothetical protein
MLVEHGVDYRGLVGSWLRRQVGGCVLMEVSKGSTVVRLVS